MWRSWASDSIKVSSSFIAIELPTIKFIQSMQLIVFSVATELDGHRHNQYRAFSRSLLVTAFRSPLLSPGVYLTGQNRIGVSVL